MFLKLQNHLTEKKQVAEKCWNIEEDL